MTVEDDVPLPVVMLYRNMVATFNAKGERLKSGEFIMGLSAPTLSKYIKLLDELGYISSCKQTYIPLAYFKEDFWKELDNYAAIKKL